VLKLPGGSGGMNIDEKTAMLIKAYELEPLPKLALETGERATKDLLYSGQYLGHLLRKRYLGWLGFDREVELLDKSVAQRARDDPVYGFTHYIVDHGVANVFGKQLFEGKMPLEPSIGAASAIGIVEKDLDGTTKVYRKKALGLKNEPLRETAKHFHKYSAPEEPRKEPYEYIIEEQKKKRQALQSAQRVQGELGTEQEEPTAEQQIEDDEERMPVETEEDILYEDDMEPSWLKGSTPYEDQMNAEESELDDEREVAEEQRGIPLWQKETMIQEEGEEQYILPFDVRNDDMRWTEEDRQGMMIPVAESQYDTNTDERKKKLRDPRLPFD
jgi:hypothetical protein